MKLIDKDALVAEIERLFEKAGNSLGEYRNGAEHTLISINYFIDTLEVKEVNLEKEHKDWLHQHFNGSRDHNASGDYLQRSSQLDMAKHFFELGLKAQKGEQIMKKKKYIREGGICQFFDQWSENGKINHQKLSRAIFHPETIEQHTERSEESYIAEAIINSKETTKETNDVKFINDFE